MKLKNLKGLSENEKRAFDNLQEKLTKFSKLKKLLEGNTGILNAKNIMLAKFEGILKEEIPEISDSKVKKIKQRILDELLGAV